MSFVVQAKRRQEAEGAAPLPAGEQPSRATRRLAPFTRSTTIAGGSLQDLANQQAPPAGRHNQQAAGRAHKTPARRPVQPSRSMLLLAQTQHIPQSASHPQDPATRFDDFVGLQLAYDQSRPTNQALPGPHEVHWANQQAGEIQFQPPHSAGPNQHDQAAGSHHISLARQSALKRSAGHHQQQQHQANQTADAPIHSKQSPLELSISPVYSCAMKSNHHCHLFTALRVCGLWWWWWLFWSACELHAQVCLARAFTLSHTSAGGPAVRITLHLASGPVGSNKLAFRLAASVRLELGRESI